MYVAYNNSVATSAVPGKSQRPVVLAAVLDFGHGDDLSCFLFVSCFFLYENHETTDFLLSCMKIAEAVSFLFSCMVKTTI